MDIKQVIVMQKGLNTRRGKDCAQASHASLQFLLSKMERITNENGKQYYEIGLNEVEDYWCNDNFRKVVARVESEAELLAIAEKAKEAGVECHVIQDSGLTEFGGVPTYTCLALGPDLSTKLDPLTGHLKLL